MLVRNVIVNADDILVVREHANGTIKSIIKLGGTDLGVTESIMNVRLVREGITANPWEATCTGFKISLNLCLESP